jgi:hypothetical protein
MPRTITRGPRRAGQTRRLEDLGALGGRQPVDVDDPFEVVALVLQAAGQQPGADDPDGVAVDVDAADLGGVGAGQVGVLPRHRQAALAVEVEAALAARRQVQHGVHDVGDDVLARGLGLGVGAVDDEDAGVDADLVGGQPDPVGGVHRGEHVRHELDEVVVERRHRGARAVQHRREVPGDGVHDARAALEDDGFAVRRFGGGRRGVFRGAHDT